MGEGSSEYLSMGMGISLDGNAGVLTLAIASVIPGHAQHEPGISQPSSLDSGFMLRMPRNDGGATRQKPGWGLAVT